MAASLFSGLGLEFKVIVLFDCSQLLKLRGMWEDSTDGELLAVLVLHSELLEVSVLNSTLLAISVLHSELLAISVTCSVVNC